MAEIANFLFYYWIWMKQIVKETKAGQEEEETQDLTTEHTGVADTRLIQLSSFPLGAEDWNSGLH